MKLLILLVIVLAIIAIALSAHIQRRFTALAAIIHFDAERSKHLTQRQVARTMQSEIKDRL